MKKTKILAMVLCLAMLAGILVACDAQTLPGGEPGGAAETTTQEEHRDENNDDGAEVKKNTGRMEYYLLPNEKCYGVRIETAEDLIKLDIPESYRGKPVAEVRLIVFYGADSLKKVNIPEGVTDLYVYAFSDCTSLKSVTLPNSIEYIYLDLGMTSVELEEIYYMGTKSEWRLVDVEGNFWIPRSERPEFIYED